MNRFFLLLLLTVGCSAPRPSGTPSPDAVMSGDTTAKTASEAARNAEQENKTGLIVASSNESGAAEPEPTTQPSEPAVTENELEVEFVHGALTMHGEPIADFKRVAADAVAADPNVILSISSTEQVPHDKIAEVTDTAKAAGIRRVKVRITVDESRSEDAAEPVAPSEPAKPANKEKPASP